MPNKITLNLTVQEVNFILQTLGQLPTNSGVFPLMMNIKDQAEAQVEKETPEN